MGTLQRIKNRTGGYYRNVLMYQDFSKDFRAIFKGDTKSIKRYEKWLLRKLDILEEQGVICTDGVRFEALKGNDKGIYSIRSQESESNVRVLYFFFNENRSILLTAIKEHNSRDYDFGCAKAKNIMHQLEEGA